MARTPGPISFIKGVIDFEEAAGDFIANGPSTGLAGYARDEYRKRCQQFGNAPGWARALAAGPAGSLGRVCAPYLDAIGADSPTLAPPFQGGQCAGSVYGFFAEQFRPSTQTFAPSERIGGASTLVGPITGFVRIEGAPCNVSGFDGVELQIRVNSGAPGSPFVQFNGGCSVVAPSGDLGYRNFRAVAEPGFPDGCGDPEAELQPGPNPPPDPGPTPGPEPTENPNDPTGIPLLPVPPYDDPIGGPTAIEGEDQTGGDFDPTAIPGNTDSQEGGGENIGDAIAVDPGPDGGGDDVEFGEPPAGRVWVGALLQFAIPDAYGIIPGSGPANAVSSRVVGNASLTYQNGRGTPQRVNGGNIDLFRPNGALKVTGVYVNSLPGITYNVRPVSIEKCPENSCGAPE